MPDFSPPRPADIVALYHQYLRLDSQRYDLRQGIWRSYDIERIQEAINAAFAHRDGIEFRYPTVFEKASVLAKSLVRLGAFTHDCDTVALKVAIMLIVRAGYNFSFRPSQNATTLAEWLEECSNQRA